MCSMKLRSWIIAVGALACRAWPPRRPYRKRRSRSPSHSVEPGTRVLPSSVIAAASSRSTASTWKSSIPSRPGPDPSRGRRQHGYRHCLRRIGGCRHLRARRAPIRIIGSEMIGAPDLYWDAGRLAHQAGRGPQWQDGRVFSDWIVEPCRPAGAHCAAQAYRRSPPRPAISPRPSPRRCLDKSMSALAPRPSASISWRMAKSGYCNRQ